MIENTPIEIPFSNPKQFLSLTGVTIEIFNKLLPFFDLAEKEIINERYEERRKVFPMFTRKSSETRHQGKLNTPQIKLYFILFYYKNYPLQQVMANIFKMNVSSANKNIHKYSYVLKRALSMLNVLPARTLLTPEDISQALEGIDKVFIDVTERPINRPSDYEEQRDNFSGKKHQHTNKNLIIATEEKIVTYLGPTTAGTHHDYRMLKDELPPENNLFENIAINVDLGFEGVKKDYQTKKQTYHIKNQESRKRTQILR
jgi:hypothetical protein